jgi:aspartate aminotransferase
MGTPRLRVSSRVLALKPSVTVAFMNRAKQLQRQGVDVLSFAAGEPDFDTPTFIKDAAIESLRAGQTKYMPTLGDPDTRASVAKKITEENGIPGVTAEHVAIGSGGKHSLFVACHVLLDDPWSVSAVDAGAWKPASRREDTVREEVLLPVPTWVSYAPIAELAGGRVIELKTTPESGFKITPGQLKAAITPRSRLLILNSPSNPCGTMYSEAELRAIAAVVAEAAATIAPNLVVLSDEIYEKIVYGGVPHFSIGSVAEIAERTITLNGLSKAYAMTGWRIGYVVGSGAFGLEFTKAMATLQGQMSTNITSFVYPAIRAALAKGADDVARMRDAFAKRGDLITKRLAGVSGVSLVRPTGAFYAFPDVSAHFGKVSPAGKKIASAMEMAEALLGEAHVAFVPGEDFGGCGGNHVRISFACSEEQINRGVDRFAEFLGKLK